MRWLVVSASVLIAACGSSTAEPAADVLPAIELGRSGGGSDVGERGPRGDADAGSPGVSNQSWPVAALPYEALLNESRRILAATRSTTYTHKTFIDEGSGTFDTDCSGLLDYAMTFVYPEALATLESKTESRPRAKDFVQLTAKFAPIDLWHVVARVADLVPGDIIAWLEPAGQKSVDTGHVMVVSALPTKGNAANELYVTVIDSAAGGHGEGDTRRAGQSGVGEGTIALVVDAGGAPTAYRWSTDARARAMTTTIALAHLE